MAQSATATVQVTVSGNRAPSVTLVADPESGTAPLRVRFEANGTDPEGGNVRYSYTFGDGSRPENGRRANHNYRQPGTYTATVTATDRDGASSTAEAEITVTFSAAGVDPEGGALDYRWTFGDQSTGASGTEVGHRYRGRGNYTARVTVTDSEGARGSAELEIAVTRRGGS